MLKPKKISKSFSYTSMLHTEIEFNDPAYQDNWRDSFIRIKLKNHNGFLKINGESVDNIQFEINGSGECKMLKMALLHFVYTLETELVP
jgi:hypothetical protein